MGLWNKYYGRSTKGTKHKSLCNDSQERRSS